MKEDEPPRPHEPPALLRGRPQTEIPGLKAVFAVGCLVVAGLVLLLMGLCVSIFQSMPGVP